MSGRGESAYGLEVDSEAVIPVPRHGGMDIPAGTVRSILAMAGVSWEEFLALR